MATTMSPEAAASRLMEMTIAHWAGELLLQAAEMSLADKFTGDESRNAVDLAVQLEQLSFQVSLSFTNMAS